MNRVKVLKIVQMHSLVFLLRGRARQFWRILHGSGVVGRSGGGGGHVIKNFGIHDHDRTLTHTHT